MFKIQFYKPLFEAEIIDFKKAQSHKFMKGLAADVQKAFQRQEEIEAETKEAVEKIRQVSPLNRPELKSFLQKEFHKGVTPGDAILLSLPPYSSGKTSNRQEEIAIELLMKHYDLIYNGLKYLLDNYGRLIQKIKASDAPAPQYVLQLVNSDYWGADSDLRHIEQLRKIYAG